MTKRPIEPSPSQLMAAQDVLADPRFFTRAQLIEAAKILGKAFQREASLASDDEVQRSLEITAENLINRRIINSIIPTEYI